MTATATQPALDSRPSLKNLEWQAIRYVDGDLANGLDAAKAAITKRAKAEGRVVGEWVKSGALMLSTERVQAGTSPRDGSPVYETRRACALYLVAVTKAAPPERWVRLTSTSGPAAVEVATVETRTGKGGERMRVLVDVKEYHQEDYRSVAVGKAMMALEEVGG